MARHKPALPGVILGHGTVSLDQWNQIQLNKPSIRPHSIASLAKEYLPLLLTRITGIGVVIRDSLGLVLGSLSKKLP